MATQDDVRRIARSLPETLEADDRFAFSVLNRGKAKGFVWIWQERVEPKKPRVPNLAAIGKRELEELITDAWRCLAPRALVKEFEESNGG